MRGFAAYGRFVAAAPPRVLDTRTLISCRWDTGGDGHRRIMAKHRPNGMNNLCWRPYRPARAVAAASPHLPNIWTKMLKM